MTWATLTINLEKSVESQKYIQPHRTPRKLLKTRFTNQVASVFKNSLCTPVVYAYFRDSTDFSRIKQFLTILVLLVVMLLPEQSLAEESGGEELESIMYFEIEPKILTFYQGTGRKIGYVVVQINVAVRGQDNYDLVELHLPLIQDNLIDFFNRQDKSIIQPFSERENLRLMAKDSVAAVLKEETGKDIVENVLFTDYVYQ